MAKISLKIEAKYDVAKLRANCGVRYWEDGLVNGIEDERGDLIPLRNGDRWNIVIDVDTGIIEGWPEGTTASLHYKVADEGIYSLVSRSGEVITTKDGYVPGMLSPAGEGFGDYVIMNIGADGKIEGWCFDASCFEGDG